MVNQRCGVRRNSWTFSFFMTLQTFETQLLKTHEHHMNEKSFKHQQNFPFIEKI